MAKFMGIDVGSTTVKVCVLSESLEILYTSYERHFARVKECVLGQLSVVKVKFGGDFRVCITGSAGLGLAERSGIPFVQEVQAAFTAIRQYYPELLNRYRQIGIASRGAFVNTERLVAEEDAKYGVMPFSTALLRRDRSLEKNLPAPCAGFSVLSNVIWYETLSTEFRKTVYGSIVLPYSSPDALQSITRAAERRSRECPWVRIWCALNEPELNSPEFALDRVASESNFKQYAELELAVARGVRSGNPKALVGSSSTAVLNRDRLRSVDRLLTVLGDRLRYDCFVFHIYREAPEYPDLDADLQAAFAMLKKHGYHNTPIYCSEGMHWKPYRMPGLISSHWVDVPWGPLSYDMGQQERIAAAKRARTWLVGLKNIDRVKQMNSSTNFWGFEMDCALTPVANQKRRPGKNFQSQSTVFVREGGLYRILKYMTNLDLAFKCRRNMTGNFTAVSQNSRVVGIAQKILRSDQKRVLHVGRITVRKIGNQRQNKRIAFTRDRVINNINLVLRTFLDNRRTVAGIYQIYIIRHIIKMLLTEWRYTDYYRSHSRNISIFTLDQKSPAGGVNLQRLCSGKREGRQHHPQQQQNFSHTKSPEMFLFQLNIYSLLPQ